MSPTSCSAAVQSKPPGAAGADSGDEARSRCQFVVVQAVGGSTFAPVLAGRSLDELDRGPDGRWRFRDRLVISDLTGDLSRHHSPG